MDQAAAPRDLELSDASAILNLAMRDLASPPDLASPRDLAKPADLNGMTWTTVDSGTTRSLYRIWGDSAKDIWMTGNGLTMHHL